MAETKQNCDKWTQNYSEQHLDCKTKSLTITFFYIVCCVGGGGELQDVNS